MVLLRHVAPRDKTVARLLVHLSLTTRAWDLSDVAVDALSVAATALISLATVVTDVNKCTTELLRRGAANDNNLLHVAGLTKLAVAGSTLTAEVLRLLAKRRQRQRAPWSVRP